MKILVGVKRLVDYQVKIRVKPDGSSVETENVKMSTNPFDEIALEEAVRMKEQGLASEVIAVSIGDESAQESLRHALAIGADRAILVKQASTLSPLQIAKTFKAIASKENPQLIIFGKQAIDNDCNQTGQMLAALLAWPQATFASKINVIDKELKVTREVDGGLETIKVLLPAVVTTDLRLNEPRFASLPNIMKAKSKSIDTLTIAELGLEFGSCGQELLHVEPPVIRQAGVKVDNIKELMAILKDKGGLP